MSLQGCKIRKELCLTKYSVNNVVEIKSYNRICPYRLIPILAVKIFGLTMGFSLQNLVL